LVWLDPTHAVPPDLPTMARTPPEMPLGQYTLIPLMT